MTEEKDPVKSAATALVEMARARYALGISTDGEPFAVPLWGPPVVRLLRGGKRSLRPELARAYFDKHGKAPGQQALADALLVIEGMSGDDNAVVLAQRVAQGAAGWWIDLGDATGDAISIGPTGWTVALPPMRFRRTVLTAPLPVPVGGGSIDELWPLLNVSPADRPLVLAWLVAAVIADIPHPILALFGEQGTGKSTAAKILGGLLDPSPVPLRKAPRDAESWVTAASGSWIVPVDNLSTMPDWLSDALCRASTGDGDVRRQLYTDGGLAVFAFRRAVVLTGIDLGAVRGDLADRLLVIDLEVIGETRRLLDAELEQSWREAHPRILGALLDLAAGVAGVLPSVRLARSPRMADFARIVAAVDSVLGTNGFDRYADGARSLATDSLTADAFVVEMAHRLQDEFIGTAAELLALVVHGETRAPKNWPVNPRALTGLLTRQAPVMRRAGWHVSNKVDSHDKILRWTIAPPEIASNPAPQGPQLLPTREGSDDVRAAKPGAPKVLPAAAGLATRVPGYQSVDIAGLAGVAGHESARSQDEDAHGRQTDALERPDDRCCAVCGKPLWASQSRESGICAACGIESARTTETNDQPWPAESVGPSPRIREADSAAVDTTPGEVAAADVPPPVLDGAAIIVEQAESTADDSGARSDTVTGAVRTSCPKHPDAPLNTANGKCPICCIAAAAYVSEARPAVVGDELS